MLAEATSTPPFLNVILPFSAPSVAAIVTTPSATLAIERPVPSTTKLEAASTSAAASPRLRVIVLLLPSLTVTLAAANS